MQEKKLGKISSISFGLGGYQDAMMGLSVSLEGRGWGVNDHKGFWSANMIDCSDHADWTESDRDRNYAEVVRYVDDLLAKAKKRNVADLKGIPIEATFDGNRLNSWRVLEEVM